VEKVNAKKMDLTQITDTSIAVYFTVQFCLANRKYCGSLSN
jgi:hypothetical protein